MLAELGWGRISLESMRQSRLADIHMGGYCQKIGWFSYGTQAQ